ncbi:MAG: oxygen-dependent coproporphyrinogen oxidase [Bradymonadaceae bacterium]|nr:oxygen-dependent coproporphyrinogen oxidase [Lujinxingiaceae bacterium]
MTTLETMPMRQRMEALVHGVQDTICQAIEALDGQSFREDCWQRPGGGGGRSRVLQDGNVFEKAGVGVSVVMGELSAEAAAQMGGGREVGDLSFYATGISLVFHPHNPMAPTVHANYRYFERGDGSQPGSWWFGGGCDLTPSYLFEDDARHFHQSYRTVCDRHDPSYYARFKAQCDDYFYIPHRKESRGLGGIFFDNQHGEDPDALFDFVSDCAQAFLPSYMPIVEQRHGLPFNPTHKEWQQLRRGRYVEFNLVYDRGTKFGLRTDGRIESILMSLPLTARWEYDHSPAPESEEARLLDVLRTPRSWA